MRKFLLIGPTLLVLACGAEGEVGAPELTEPAALEPSELTSTQGTSLQGTSLQSLSLQGTSLQGTSLQGLELTGTRVDKDGHVVGTVRLRIDEVKTDTSQNLFDNVALRSNSDVTLYLVRYYEPQPLRSRLPGTWRDLCVGATPDDRFATALAGTWDIHGRYQAPSRANPSFTFSCLGGTLTKCARVWGYKPWKSAPHPTSPTTLVPLGPYHRACAQAAMADYCKDGTSFTQNGTRVDIYDNIGLVKREAEDTLSGFAEESSFGESGAGCVSKTRWANDVHHCAADIQNGEDDAAMPGYVYDGTRAQCLAKNAGLGGETQLIFVDSSTYCPHSVCTSGAPMAKDCTTCTATVCALEPSCCGVMFDASTTGGWGAKCTRLAQSACGMCQYAGCAHTECVTGERLAASCSTCAKTVCDSRPSCCTGSWDATCASLGAACAAGTSTCHATPTMNFSARWTGSIVPKYGELYTFITTANQGARVWIGDQVVSEGWPDQSPWSFGKKLLAGVRYPITVEFQSAAQSGIAGFPTAHVKLEWQSARQAREVVPAGSLYPTVTVQAGGRGLQANYYDREPFLGGAVTLARYNETVDFNWGTGSPAAAIPADHFTVHWQGLVEPRYTQTYTFCTVSDDGVRLSIDGKTIVDNWTPHGPTENCGQIALKAGYKYDILLAYFESTGGSTIRMTWQSPSQPKQTVPSTALYSVPSPTTAIVVGNTGTGLTGEYFDTRDFLRLVTRRIDPRVLFDWRMAFSP